VGDAATVFWRAKTVGVHNPEKARGRQACSPSPSVISYARVLRLAEEDDRVVGGAAVGSLAVAGGDRFSDLDLTFGVAGHVPVTAVLVKSPQAWPEPMWASLRKAIAVLTPTEESALAAAAALLATGGLAGRSTVASTRIRQYFLHGYSFATRQSATRVIRPDTVRNRRNSRRGSGRLVSR
jgi:hypothetical protein